MKRAAVVGLVIAGVLVVGVGGAVALSSSGGEDGTVAVQTPTTASTPDEDMDDTAEEPADETEAAEEADTEEVALSPGAYVEYSEAALADAEGQRVLFFHASWCPTCHALEDDIEAQGVPDGITILKVDYDSNQDLRQKYGVVQQSTVVSVDESGDAEQVFIAYEDPSIDAALIGLGLNP